MVSGDGGDGGVLSTLSNQEPTNEKLINNMRSHAKKIYINYSSNNYVWKRRFAFLMALFNGRFDRVQTFSVKDIDDNFQRENINILSKKRGAGYWLWKPYIILKSLRELRNGDYLLYADAGAFMLKKVDILIEELELYNQDIMGFELPLIEEQWTKRELFTNMDCDFERYKNSNQIHASIQLVKKNDFSVNFYESYLRYAQSEINITDDFDPAFEQSTKFIEHRHDQSIFSLLYKKNNLKPFKDPTQWGQSPEGYAGCAHEIFEPNKLYELANGRLFRYHRYPQNYELILYHNRSENPLKSYARYIKNTFLENISRTTKNMC